ncbi:GNAT family N-acetyltransferase [Pedobacter sp. HMF7647]|uniref:GNAT family N-acetyltransferase n=1 Tax=Hufsiella arboris TaxID=2695275 RepID=A0A7K1Y7P2_9SPHI|nr:GNAT family N-acetyltransferase [Hufsiella arboris]MXV50139.1 GNAT family N-acetyltransferase [Hufsiella arboris]
MTPFILSTERLGLRKWLESDNEPFVKMNKDPAVMQFFPKTLTDIETAEMMQRINEHFDKNGFGLFALENKQTRKFIGFTGLAIPRFEAFFTPCVEIGWRLKKEAWGQGFATEAAKACLNYGFNTIGLDKIVSFTSVLNINSEKVMKRIGMRYVTEFEHPKVEKNSILSKHVLYEISRSGFTFNK